MIGRMINKSKKEVIESFSPGDWFDKIPPGVLCNSDITAINVDRCYGKTRFIVESIGHILKYDLADYIQIDTGFEIRTKIINKMITEKYGEEFRGKNRIEVFPKKYKLRSYGGKGVTIFIDDAESQPDIVDDAITGAIRGRGSTYVLLGTSYSESHTKLEKNYFEGLLEMPFVNTYEVIGKLPDDVFDQLSENVRMKVIARAGLLGECS